MSRDGFKVFISGLAIILLLATAVLSYSETKGALPEPQPKSKTIFDYKNELALTNSQENEIRKILDELNRELRKNRAQMVILNTDVEELINKEADMPAIKKKLSEAAAIQVSSISLDIEASRKIKKILTPEQIKKWKELRRAK